MMKMMKMMQVILLISLFFSACSQGEQGSNYSEDRRPEQQLNLIDTIKVIHDIDNKVKLVDSRQLAYGEVEQSLLGLSSEGSSVNSYYDDMTLVKIKAAHYGEMGNVELQYYLGNGKLIFIKEKYSNYNKPMYYDDSEIKSVENNTYYFFNGVLLKSIAKKPTSQMDLLNGFEEIKAQLENYEPSNKILAGDTVRCKLGSRCLNSGYVIKESRSKGRVKHVKPPLNKNAPMEQD